MRLAFMVTVEVPEGSRPVVEQDFIYHALREVYDDDVLVEARFFPTPWVREHRPTRTSADGVRDSDEAKTREPDGEVPES